MNKLSLILTAALGLSLSACHNETKPTEVPAPAATAPAAETKAPVFQPYKGLILTHTVKDFDKWNAAFAKDDSLQKAYGLTMSGIGRGLDNDKQVVILFNVADVAKAKALVASPGLKKSMTAAGVTSAPSISYVDVIYDDTTTIPQKERLMVTHHVKDFDTWKKAFDTESAATRAANGMIERAMARGIDDPNTVSILFAITDMAKVKARVASPDMKKVMTDAGVDGPPQLTWFKWVNQ